MPNSSLLERQASRNACISQAIENDKKTVRVNRIRLAYSTGGAVIFLSGFLTLFLTVNKALSESPPVLKFAFSHMPSFTYCTGSEINKGVFFEVGILIARESGYKPIPSCYPAVRLYKNIGNGASDVMFGIREADSLQGNAIFSKRKYATVELMVYSADNFPVPQSFEDLRNKELATILGYSYGKLWPFIQDKRNNIKIHTVNSHRSAFTMLKSGRAD